MILSIFFYSLAWQFINTVPCFLFTRFKPVNHVQSPALLITYFVYIFHSNLSETLLYSYTVVLSTTNKIYVVQNAQYLSTHYSFKRFRSIMHSKQTSGALVFPLPTERVCEIIEAANQQLIYATFYQPWPPDKRFTLQIRSTCVHTQQHQHEQWINNKMCGHCQNIVLNNGRRRRRGSRLRTASKNQISCENSANQQFFKIHTFTHTPTRTLHGDCL